MRLSGMVNFSSYFTKKIGKTIDMSFLGILFRIEKIFARLLLAKICKISIEKIYIFGHTMYRYHSKKFIKMLNL